MDYDAFEQVYEIIKSVLESQTEKEDDDEDNTKENRENQISLKIIAYETLGEVFFKFYYCSSLFLVQFTGKAWPENSPETQTKYRDLFVKHCVEALPNVTRTVQVGIVSALYNFVNKLCLLQKTTLSESEASQLSGIVNQLLAAIKYAFSKFLLKKIIIK